MPDMPDHDRRKTDERFDQLEETICKAFDDHVTGWHPPMNAAEVVDLIETRKEKLTALESVVDRMVEMLEGREVTDMRGNVIDHERGLKETADRSYAMLQTIEDRTNGGITITQKIRPVWSRNQKVAAASIGVTFVLGTLSQIVLLVVHFTG